MTGGASGCACGSTAFLAVEPVQALVVDHPALALEQDVQASISVADPARGQILQPHAQCRSRIAAGPVPVGGPSKAVGLTGPALRHGERRLEAPDLPLGAGRASPFFSRASCSIVLSRLRSATKRSAWRSPPRAASDAGSPTRPSRRRPSSSDRTSLRRPPSYGRSRQPACRSPLSQRAKAICSFVNRFLGIGSLLSSRNRARKFSCRPDQFHGSGPSVEPAASLRRSVLRMIACPLSAVVGRPP